MKMRKIEIRNYRSLQDVTIYPKDLLALVGRNNSGKSNVLKALEFFFEGSTNLVDDECFHSHDTTKPIEITITFEQLSDWEKEKFRPWMNGDSLVVGREICCRSEDSYEVNTIAVIKIPEPEWLQEEMICGDNIAAWWAKKDSLKANSHDFGQKLGTSKPTVGQWKEAANQFLKDHGNEIPWKEEKRKNPKGYPGVLKGALPEFIFIRAVRDISEEAKVGRTNPFGQLIQSVFEKVPGEQKVALEKQLEGIGKRLNRRGETDRIAEIRNLENRLNELMSEIMECDVELEIGLPRLSEVLGAAKIYADDGVRTTIETKGHGMQRSMIFTILRAYAELTHAQKAGDKANERTTIFAVEEPELYLHPQSQRTLMSVFREIALERNQIVYSTQSSLFVDVSHFDEICIMRREKKEKGFQSYPSQLFMSALIDDLKARKGIDATEEGMREQYSNAFNPVINEGFFAEKVVIVEGSSEQYALPIYADCLGYDFNRNNVSVVHSDGKGQMDRLLRIFSGFRIPAYLWFDGDKSSEDKDVKEKTIELLKLCGQSVEKIEDVTTIVSDRYAVLESTFEELLTKELVDYEKIVSAAKSALGPTGKPLKHRFIARFLKDRIDKGEQVKKVLPKTIVDIIGKIRNLTETEDILQKPKEQ